MSFGTVSVLGLGKVGLLAATFLDEAGIEVVGIDQRPPRYVPTFPVKTCNIADPETLRAELTGTEAVLSCLPFHLNRPIAELAYELGIHYFDLTEDVPTTKAIVELSKTSAGLMAPQCGLAPGFASIVAASQIASFDVCRSVRMRVGALPQFPTGLLGYSFNWSPEGVVNEYLNDCEVVEEGVHKWVSSMEWRETLVIDGVQLEAFTTSGGLGTMCDTYGARVANIDYKTIRYPGHVDLMNFFFHELLMRERRDLAAEILTNAKPPVDDDVVYVHVSAEGQIDGHLRRTEFVRSYMPKMVGGRMSTAIAWTTAGSVASVIEMVRKGTLPRRGLLKQEDIPLDAFLATPTGRLFAE
ncbi:MAG: saccharopine dehydrogenase NADP-binding domain-containing protein [Actinobacteria bacterium]|nr:saccharopine dehydrogenase NADP-binding domain-containing protein [Actinomycetota bacterium]